MTYVIIITIITAKLTTANTNIKYLKMQKLAHVA